ncbi:MAG: c-type cytochrome [Gammaproteobacteria bacterium]
MRKWFKRAGIAAGVMVAAVGVLFALAWFKAEADMARVYEVNDPPLVLAGDEAELARGAHLYQVAGCVECHGEGGRGKVFIDAGPVARVVAPNLTPAALRGRYDVDQLAAAIRHGVGPDGRPLRVMPSGDFIHLTDADTAALVAHLQALPDSDNNPGATEIRPLGRVLHLFGKLHLVPAASPTIRRASARRRRRAPPRNTAPTWRRCARAATAPTGPASACPARRRSCRRLRT